MKTVDAVILSNVKRLRAARGWSQSKLAAAARAVGLDWGRGHVAALENGTRRLYLAEAIALMHAFGVTWDELADAGVVSSVEITSALSCVGSRLPALIRGTHTLPVDVAALEQLLSQQRSDFTDADRKAARNLSAELGFDIDASMIVSASDELWSRSYDAERDRRALANAPDEASERAMQARRAHASRELYAELQTYFAEEHARTKRSRSGVQTRASLKQTLAEHAAKQKTGRSR